MTTTPIETVKKIYEAFGRGDFPVILEHLSDDVVWEYGTIDSGVPWLAHRRGRRGAAEFFATLQTLNITRFEINDIVGGGNVVVGLINIDMTVKATGKTIEERDEVHVWRFDERGRVVRFRHVVDTLAHARALT